MRENGRSMVEMLGVLAIIGVLSVGAISGYSKAMMKYKLNKSVESISYLLNIAYMYMFEIKPTGGNSSKDRSLIPYFIKMNLIPENMIKGNETSYLYDAFGNQIEIFNNDPWGELAFVARFSKAGNAKLQLCAEVFSMAQMYYDYIVYIYYVNDRGSQRYSGGKNSNYPDMRQRQLNSFEECVGTDGITIMFRNSK